MFESIRQSSFGLNQSVIANAAIGTYKESSWKSSNQLNMTLEEIYEHYEEIEGTRAKQANESEEKWAEKGAKQAEKLQKYLNKKHHLNGNKFSKRKGK
jgi:hypothetical protein